MNKQANKMKVNKNDIYHTPLPVVKKMIEMCHITPDMKVLDPCYGAGAFYNNLPECDKHWAEIEKGNDFFELTGRYDLIIGNPPYSLWTKWLEHTMKLTDKFCYIIGTLNLTPKRLDAVLKNGFGVTQMHSVSIDWWFAHSYLVVFEKNKPSIVTSDRTNIVCDICNTRCKRGVNGNDVNKCYYVAKVSA